MRYHAFISYNQRDNAWAEWLHHGLETYRIPKGLEEKAEQYAGEDFPKKLFPVFRDRDELPSAHTISEKVREALAESRALIVICSPNSAQSEWVATEIQFFRELHPERPVLALIADGEPPTCFPDALMLGGEPLAADARLEGDGKPDAKLKLIAGLLGVGFGIMKNRETKRKRRRLIIAVSALSAITLSFAGLTLWALRAEREASQQRHAAETSRELAERREGEAVAAKQVAETTSDVNRRYLYLAEMNLAGRSLNEPGGATQISEILDRWKPAGGEPDLRGWEWYYLKDQLEGASLVISHRSPGHAFLGPEGDRLIVRGGNGFSVWDAHSGERHSRVGRWVEGQSSRSLALSPDGTRALLTYNTGSVAVWDVDAASQIWEASSRDENGDGAWAGLWSSDGQRVASLTRTGIQLWNAATGEGLMSIAAGEDERWRHMAWSPDDQLFAIVAEGSKELLLVDVDSGDVVRRAPIGFSSPTCIDWSPDGQHLALGTSNWKAVTGDIDTLKMVGIADHHGRVTSVAWSPDGRHLATGGEDAEVKIIAVDGAEESTVRLIGHSSSVNSLEWSADGRRIVSSATGSDARIWEFDGDSEGQDSGLSGHRNWVDAVAWSPDGTRIASCGNDRTIIIWDATSRQPLRVLKGHSQRVWKVVWSADGKRLASCSQDRSVRVWEADTGEVLSVFDDIHFGKVGVDLGPEGATVATFGRDGKPRLSDSQTGELRWVLEHPGGSNKLATDPEGKRLAVAGANWVTVWDLLSGEEIQRIQLERESVGATGGGELVWEDDGKRIAIGSRDRLIRIVDLDAERQVMVLRGHSAFIENLAWHPTEPRLVSSDLNGTVRMWDMETGRQTLEFSRKENVCHGLAWSPDGRELATTGNEGYVIQIRLAEIGDEKATVSPEASPGRDE